MQKDNTNLAQYLFHEGTNYSAWEYMGAHKFKDYCVFRVWAPNAKEVYVTGDFCKWDNRACRAEKITEGGIYECVIPGVAEFQNYKFVIITNDGREILKSDPYAFHSETRPGTASKIYDIEKYNGKSLVESSKQHEQEVVNQAQEKNTKLVKQIEQLGE